MHIWANLQNFLYDKDYFLAYFNDSLYIYNFNKVYLITKTKIILSIKDMKITIKGNNLILRKSCGTELLIHGEIKEIKYE